MPTRVLRNPNIESSIKDHVTGSTAVNKENPTSFRKSIHAFESTMNPSSDFVRNRDDNASMIPERHVSWVQQEGKNDTATVEGMEATLKEHVHPTNCNQEEVHGPNENVHGWNDPKVLVMKMSFVNDVVSDKPTPKINFRSLVNEERVEDSDFVLPVKAITMAQNRFANSLVGYFVGLFKLYA
nr:hypothetical protein [Tanacetum cinerariifolium]GFA05485.1 hypothetical protein [Tanacetum cinerariifolium]